MKTMRFLKTLLTATLLCGVLANAVTQPQGDLTARLSQEEQEALATLVLYPEEFRTAILDASLYPEALIQMQRLQTRSRDDFRALVAGYSQEDQAMLWELSRYRDLVHRLASEAYQRPAALPVILRDYPASVQDMAREVMREHPALMVKINGLLLQTEADFDVLLAAYPMRARVALHQLLDLPEALALMTEQLEMTLLLGDSYRHDPVSTRRQIDELSLQMARRQAAELAEWQENLRDDPQAMADLKQAAEEYRGEYAYDDEYYDYEPEEKEVIVYYRYVPYSYWFGYPHWYMYPRWRPVPVWYDFGFYVVIDGPVIITRLPSPFFVHWYFYRPDHHYRYPHLSDRFVHHAYYGPRHIGSSIGAGVRHWQRTNGEVINERWLRDENRRVERIREFGQFETERLRLNREKAVRERSQIEYLEQNRNRYPNLRTYNEPVLKARERGEKAQTGVPEVDRDRDRVRDQDRIIVPPRTDRPKAEPRTTQRPRAEPKPTEQPRRPAVVKPRNEPQKQKPKAETKEKQKTERTRAKPRGTG